MPADPRLARVCDAILDDPASKLTLDEWARACAMSGRSLARLFLAETRMTFGRWRQQARLLASLPRLARGDGVLGTALDLGYDSPSAFTAMFRKALGTTPSRYFRRDDGD
jgi:AraC-like DNA-binding protein